MTHQQKLLVVGNGMSSVRLCEELAVRCPGRFAITICGAEPQPGYNRVLLSSFLAGQTKWEDLALRPRSWYEESGMTLLTGASVCAVDFAARQALLADNTMLGFDRLVFATGSRPVMLPKPGMDLPGVLAFRDLEDAQVAQGLGEMQADVVVIGGGLLGIEAANGLARCGAKVTLVHLMDRLMERQLDAPAAGLLRTALARKGIRIVLGADTARIMGDTGVTGLELADGRVLPAQAVICAVGIRPSSELARAAGLHVNRGIVVDDAMACALPGVYALGECAEHRGTVYGLVEPAHEQAAIVARQLSGEADALYFGTLLATNLKVSGVGIFSAGDFMGTATSQASLLEDRDAGWYRKLVFEGEKLTGAILAGDTSDALWYRDLIRSGSDVSAMRHKMIFGQDFASSPQQQAA